MATKMHGFGLTSALVTFSPEQLSRIEEAGRKPFTEPAGSSSRRFSNRYTIARGTTAKRRVPKGFGPLLREIGEHARDLTPIRLQIY